MPYAQNVDRVFADLVSHLVLADQNAPNLARLEFVEFFADARKITKPAWCRNERLNGARGGASVDGGEKFMQSREIGQRFARPLDRDHRGSGFGLSDARLAAHASTAR